MGAPFKLVDHTGKPITDRALAGKPAAVFFGFTHCPEICPTTLVELSGWLDEIGDEGTDINAFFVSVDPVRDTPEIMRSYIENFSTRIVGVTGDPAEVSRLAKAWFVYFKKVPLDDGGYTMDHNGLDPSSWTQTATSREPLPMERALTRRLPSSGVS